MFGEKLIYEFEWVRSYFFALHKASEMGIDFSKFKIPIVAIPNISGIFSNN